MFDLILIAYALISMLIAPLLAVTGKIKFIEE